MVGDIAGEWQPPLTPPYQGGESFSSWVVSRRIMKSSLRMTSLNLRIDNPRSFTAQRRVT